MPAWHPFKEHMDRLDAWADNKIDSVKAREPRKPVIIAQSHELHSHQRRNRDTKSSRSRSSQDVKPSRSRRQIYEDEKDRPSRRRAEGGRQKAVQDTDILSDNHHGEDEPEIVDDAAIDSVQECLYNTHIAEDNTESDDGAQGQSEISTEAQTEMQTVDYDQPKSRADVAPITDYKSIILSQVAAMKSTGRSRAKLTNMAYKPTRPMPAYMPDGNGGLMLNSAAMCASAQIESIAGGSDGNFLRGTPYRIQRVESDIQEDRQVALDRYRQVNNITSSFYYCVDSKGRDFPLELPLHRSSPMRCYTHFRPESFFQDIQFYRDQMSGMVQDSFIHPLLPTIYSRIDEAINKRTKNIQAMLTNNEKRGIRRDKVNKKEWMQCDIPLVNCLESLNNHYQESGIPLRIVFRITRETPQDDYDYEFWFVFPNTIDEVIGGYETWEGVEDVSAIDKYYDSLK